MINNNLYINPNLPRINKQIKFGGMFGLFNNNKEIPDEKLLQCKDTVQEAKNKMAKVVDYGALSVSSDDLKLKQYYATKALGYLKKATTLSEQARSILNESESSSNEKKPIINELDKLHKDINKIHDVLYKEKHSINISENACRQSNELFWNKKSVDAGKVPVYYFSEPIENGLVVLPFPINSEGKLNNIHKKNKIIYIRVDTKNDTVLNKASEVLTQRLQNINSSDSLDKVKCILETETEFFNEEKTMKLQDKDGNEYNYANFKQEHFPEREISLGEFSSGGFGVPAKTATCLPQSLFAKAFSQINNIILDICLNSSHCWCEYHSDDNKTYVIDPRNKLIFDLDEKKGYEYNHKDKNYCELSKDDCNDAFEELYNHSKEIYKF
ncbi:MAG: hypothetical protein WCK67_09465 [bacterium]